MADTASGRCLCGRLQFTLRGKQLWVAHCHCESCRRSTGSAVVTFVGYKKEELTYTRGEPKFHQSSPGVHRSFCPDCGTPMTYESDRHPGEVHLYVSTMDNPAACVPQVHVFYGERIPWMELEDELPRYEALSRGAEPVSRGPLRRQSGGSPGGR